MASAGREAYAAAVDRLNEVLRGEQPAVVSAAADEILAVA